jgi:hypothetical protein
MSTDITIRQSLIEIAIINSLVFKREHNHEISSFWVNQAVLIANNDKGLLAFMELVTLIHVINSIGK